MSRYTVKQGDTLYDIAKEQLGDGNRYSEIQSASNLTSKAIYPGQILTISRQGHAATNHGSTLISVRSKV